MDAQKTEDRRQQAREALKEIDASLRPASGGVLSAQRIAKEAAAPAGLTDEGLAGATPAPAVHAPIIAIHGVGNFEHGDVIAQIASSKVYSAEEDFRRQTIYADNYRFTLLEDDKPALNNGRANPRLLEVNWSDVRKPLSSTWGLLRNFVMVLLTLTRIGVYGAEGSHVLGKPLRTPVALYVFEGVLVWAALLPMLSALLWKVDVTTRLGLGVGIGIACCYLAWLVRGISLPLMWGGVVFGALAALAGWLSCTGVTRLEATADNGVITTLITEQAGRDLVSNIAGALHSWSIMLASAVLVIVASEILFFMRGDNGDSPTWTQRYARVACLWLPVVLLIIIQPLTVSAILISMDAPAQNKWGLAFEQSMAFHPSTGLLAGGLVAITLLCAIILGALQYKLVSLRGRNSATTICIILGALLLVGGKWIESSVNLSCRCCTRPDWLAWAGLMLVGSGIVTYQLYRDHRSWQCADGGELWHPSGDCARLWAVCILWVFPAVLIAALAMLFWDAAHYAHYSSTLPSRFMSDAQCGTGTTQLHVDQAFLKSTKFALFLLPFATKPFAALLDALGDVFYFVVKQDSLQTRDATVPRLGRAIQNMARFASGQHLIIFAHSQGTVIAATLLSELEDALRSGAHNITLLTVGSPVTSLYQRFLGVSVGQEYANLCIDKPQQFQWINMCRPADYVGSSVDLPGVSNRALLTPGDHTEYWRDATLLQWLMENSEGLSEAQSHKPDLLKPIVPW